VATTSVIEMTTFTVALENTRAMPDARQGMVAAFRTARRGSLPPGVRLSRW